MAYNTRGKGLRVSASALLSGDIRPAKIIPVPQEDSAYLRRGFPPRSGDSLWRLAADPYTAPHSQPPSAPRRNAVQHVAGRHGRVAGILRHLRAIAGSHA